MYESPEFFPTLKEAEHAAAKIALMSLSPDGVQKDDYAFYKNLLQELVQKEGFCLPTYNTNKQGEAHCPVFVSTVEIEGKDFRGEEEKTKKHAEMSAAKAAYDALKACKSSQSPLILLPSQRGQESPQLLYSCLQSNISANVIPNVPMNLSSCTIPVQQVEDCTGKGGLSSSDIYGDARDTIPSAPCESNSDSSSSDIYGDARDTIPSAPCESNSDSSSPSPSPSLSNSFTNFVVDSSLEPSSNRITLTCKKVIVYPAKKPIPEGGTLLPMSDANWVAFSPPEARS
ncbi:Double-stranded RNA-binding domain containing protein [Parasponia andersonii]|uniref:Double-stranded RNA-binding domain containing protein n=1 Tax=Parasponia andersonii TaxID=3476 RepID=A0A2P5BK09_PARAD|nr:Double-stranded RNA-binding domain containing protein [Parasponia andersonii]